MVSKNLLSLFLSLASLSVSFGDISNVAPIYGLASADDFWGSHLPAQAIDGDNSTFWNASSQATPETPHWLVVDLQHVFTVNEILLVGQVYRDYEPYWGYTNEYNLYISTDGTSWTFVGAGTLTEHTSPGQYSHTYTLPGTPIRYIKYEVTGGTHWAYLNEMEVFARQASTLPEKAAELAIGVIGAPYTWGAKGWDKAIKLWLSESDIKTKAYPYWYFDRSTGKTETIHGPGLDCAGLVFWAYNKASGATKYQEWEPQYNAVHYEGANNQYCLNSTRIQRSELMPGDLLFFDAEPGSAIDHVAMYVGPFIHEGQDCDVVEATPPRVKATTVDAVIARIGAESFKGFGRVTTPQVGGTVCAHCPVDLGLTDPDGFIVNRSNWEVPGVLCYSVFDIDNDGDLDAMITIAERKPGNYSIAVVPHADASPTDTYGLVVTSGDQTLVLAENTLIRDTPHQPYLISSTESGLQIVTAQPVGDLVSVTMGRAALDAKTGQFSVNVTVKNKSSTVIAGPVWLVIDSVSSFWVTPVNTSGTTTDGKPYIDLSGLLGDGKLDPGETVTQRVYFSNPSRTSFTFKSSVRGVVAP